MTMPATQRTALGLAYAMEGRGAPCLLLHASPLAGAMWSEVAAWLAESSAVIMPDLPGFGRSVRQAAPSIPGMAQALVALLDELAIREPVIVGGLSIGGYVAFELYRQAPERIKALGLFATRAAADTEAIRQTRARTAERVRADGAAVLLETLPRLVGRTTLAERLPLVERVTRMILANEPQGLADAQLAMASRHDATGLLAGITVPTLIVAGDEDGIIPAREAEAMAAQIPGAVMRLIPRAGHFVSLEAPEAFRAALEPWLLSVTR